MTAVNQWAGIIVNGAVRNAAALAIVDLGEKGLETNSRKSDFHGTSS
jgi:regulator of ribonuclease activity A